MILLVLAGFGLLGFLLAIMQGGVKKQPKRYQYIAKKHVMTRHEERFFRILSEIFADKCYVMAQAHLSALLSHKVKGQNWRAAFSHINGKSVDFVLIKKDSLEVVCAIELDDASHEENERRIRDKEVERIFAEAKLPLVRFRDIRAMSRQEIVDKIAESSKL